MTRRAMAVAVALLVTAVGVATAATVRAARHGPDRTGAFTGSVTRLGPRDGELVSAYLARSRAALNGRTGSEPPGYALVAFDHYAGPAEVAALTGGSAMVRALVRVPLPRVQTEIVDVPARTGADILGGMGAAAARLDAEASGADPVSAAVDRAQADRLRDRCGCVLGAVVRADPAALRALDRRPGIRAVEPAPPGEPLDRLVFVPLLPEQRSRVEPPPDDGAGALAGTPAGRPGSPEPSGSPMTFGAHR
ncbi:MAG TPA: hypothetical protein VFX70_01035 [Mycobacteriales bacterium]|nr:hypothetical protein [Mycobacteriales bacterium]